MDDTVSPEPQKNRKIIANILLVATTILWGSSFILTKNLTQDIPVFLYQGLRFAIAIIGFVPYFYQFKNIDKKTILAGLLTGFVYFVSISFQTVGLQTTSAGKGAFITGLGTIIVPFIYWIGYKRRVKLRIWIAAIIAMIGMGFLLLEGESGLEIGDFLILITAVSYAYFIVLNDKYVTQVNVFLYSIFQLVVVSGLSFLFSLIIRESFNFITTDLVFWLLMLYMGIGVTTLTFIFQNWSQQYQGPSQTAIIFALEPVFAVLFASFIIGDETMTIWGWIGSAMIFGATIIAVIRNNIQIESFATPSDN